MDSFEDDVIAIAPKQKLTLSVISPCDSLNDLRPSNVNLSIDLSIIDF